MHLTKKQIIPALMENSQKVITFTDKTSLCIKDFRDTKSDLIFRDPEGNETARGSVHKIFKHVKNLEPICSWCSTRGKPATTVMPDGFLTCDECAVKVGEYYRCTACDGQLSAALGGFCRSRFERATCQTKDCNKKDDVKHGRICCMKAEYVNCVCYRAYKCPEHAPEGIHVGTHD